MDYPQGESHGTMHRGRGAAGVSLLWTGQGRVELGGHPKVVDRIGGLGANSRLFPTHDTSDIDINVRM